jgi:hypothetical protein
LSRQSELATFSKLVVTLVPIFVMNVNAATETRVCTQ